jgi:hypothetical protein
MIVTIQHRWSNRIRKQVLPNSLLLGLFLLIAVNCENDEDCVEPGILLEEKVEEIIQVTIDSTIAAYAYNLRQEDVSITGGKVMGNTLELVLEYPGGCEEHNFGLVTSGAFLKTNPPQAEFYLLHDARYDPGNGNVRRLQCFDLAPVKEYYLQWSRDIAGTVIIRVEDYDVDDIWMDRSMWYEF